MPEPARILVAWRNEPDREIVLRVLQADGWETKCAATVDEGLAAGNSEDFDLVVLDMRTCYVEAVGEEMGDLPVSECPPLTDPSRYTRFVGGKHMLPARHSFFTAPLLVVARPLREFDVVVGGWCWNIGERIAGLIDAYWNMSQERRDLETLGQIVRRLLTDTRTREGRQLHWEDVAARRDAATSGQTGD